MNLINEKRAYSVTRLPDCPLCKGKVTVQQYPTDKGLRYRVAHGPYVSKYFKFQRECQNHGAEATSMYKAIMLWKGYVKLCSD